MTAHYNRAELLTLLSQVRIPAVRLNHFNQLQDIQNNIRLVGYVIGEDDKANALIIQMNTELTALRDQLPKHQAPRVMSYSIEGFTAGAHTTFDAMLQAIGAINVSAEHGIKGVVNISSEQLIAWQPEFIVVGAAAEQFDAISQQLHAQPAFNALNGKLILLEQRYLLAASHHIVAAIQQLAEKIYAR
ncbi:MAG: ABC transporter substrate-binding protein [Thiotrichaceae bacterium]